MVQDLFGTLLKELGDSMGNIQLHPDQHNSCLIRLKEGINIQLELDRAGEFLVLGCNLGTVPPGKYRENLFYDALRTNGLPPPLHGILAFSQKTNHLVLFEKIYVKDLTGEKIAAEITPFVQKAVIWSEAIKKSEVPHFTAPYTKKTGGGIFGLK